MGTCSSSVAAEEAVQNRSGGSQRGSVSGGGDAPAGRASRSSHLASPLSSKAPPPSILAGTKHNLASRNKQPRQTATKYIAASSGGAVVGAGAGAGGGTSPPTSPAAGHVGAGAPMPPIEGHHHNPASSPKAASPKMRGDPSRRRSARRSSDGPRTTQAAFASGLLGTPAPAGGAAAAEAAGGGGRRAGHYSGRRQSIKRRTSNNGMLNHLALQFPLIRTSFFAVYRAFARYMAIVAQAEAEVRRKSLVPGGLTLLQLRKIGTESTLVSHPSGPASHRAAAAATEIQLVEEEEEHEQPTIALTEEDARKAEIAALLAAQPTPLLTAAAEELDTMPNLDMPAPALPPSSRPSKSMSLTVAAAAAAASAADMSVNSVRVQALGTLTPAKLGEALQAICGSAVGDTSDTSAGLTLSPDEISALFRLSDLDGSESISFREFLVAVACGCFLKHDIEMDRAAAAAAATTASAESNGFTPVITVPTPPTLPSAVPTHSVRPVSLSSQKPSPRRLEASTATLEAFRPPVSPRRLELRTDPATMGSGPGPSASPSAASTTSGRPSQAPLSPSNATLAVPGSSRVGQGIVIGGRPGSATSPRGGAHSRGHSRGSSSPAAALNGLPPRTFSFSGAAAGGLLGSALSPYTGPGSSNPHFLSVQKGFRVVFAAFHSMDADHSGGVDIAELKRALFAASTLKCDKEVLERRFKELDLNGDAEINFPEFLYGVVSWVGLMDEDDVDELAVGGR